MELASPQAGRTRPRNTRWLIFLATIGPGLTVMLADTDAGSVITAAQSGAQWGYKLLWIQLLLIPFLYFIFELTVRIGITTGKGHGELIREYFGAKWAWISVTTLFDGPPGCAGSDPDHAFKALPPGRTDRYFCRSVRTGFYTGHVGGSPRSVRDPALSVV